MSNELRFLRLPEVIAITGLSRSTIYHKISRNEFPHSINLGPRAVGWLYDDVIDWILQRIEQSRRPEGAE